MYKHIDSDTEWVPMQRLLVDSDEKHLIYVLDVKDRWEHVRFPLELWKTLDEAVIKDQDLMLVVSQTPEGSAHKTVLLKDFVRELKELIPNMQDNANYGEDMSILVEEHFSKTIQQLY